MRYLLDTNACICYLRGSSALLKQQVLSLPTTSIVVCAVVKMELHYGAMKSQRPAESIARYQEFTVVFHSLPFDDAAAERCGEVRALLARLGKPIGPYDLQVAAIALANQVTLVTHNTEEFSRVPGLLLEDWETA